MLGTTRRIMTRSHFLPLVAGCGKCNVALLAPKTGCYGCRPPNGKCWMMPEMPPIATPPALCFTQIKDVPTAQLSRCDEAGRAGRKS